MTCHQDAFPGFSVAVGALNDRFDSRRIIQCGMVLFILASLGWGYFFVTGTLEIWSACLLLVLHGCAGVLWQTSSQVLLHDIVGPENLPSAVRLNATARYLGVLLGPAVGGGLMIVAGPKLGIFINTAFYLPLVIWSIGAPYGRHFRAHGQVAMKRAVRGLADIVQTIRDIRTVPVIGIMLVLGGGASFFVGNSYQASMPEREALAGAGRRAMTMTATAGCPCSGQRSHPLSGCRSRNPEAYSPPRSCRRRSGHN